MIFNRFGQRLDNPRPNQSTTSSLRLVFFFFGDAFLGFYFIFCFVFVFFFLIFEKKSCGFVTFWVSSSLLCWVASSLFYWFSSTRFIFFVLLGFLLRSSSPLYGARFL